MNADSVRECPPVRPHIGALDDVFPAAVEVGFAVFTENVADFARIAADHLTVGHHHPGVLIALSSRLSHRPAGRAALVAAVLHATGGPLADRVVFLRRAA